jgi:hypothetical protein
MAIVDKLTEFCDATALNTGAPGTYLLGSQVDLGAASINIGNGHPTVYLVVRCTTDVTVTTTTGTLAVKLASDSTAAIATDGSATVHLVSATFTGTGVDAGDPILVAALPVDDTYERYLGILQVTGTEALTAGNIDAYLTLNPPSWKAYPDAL